jgi:hypothetical protein
VCDSSAWLDLQAIAPIGLRQDYPNGFHSTPTTRGDEPMIDRPRRFAYSNFTFGRSSSTLLPASFHTRALDDLAMVLSLAVNAPTVCFDRVPGRGADANAVRQSTSTAGSIDSTLGLLGCRSSRATKRIRLYVSTRRSRTWRASIGLERFRTAARKMRAGDQLPMHEEPLVWLEFMPRLQRVGHDLEPARD